MNKNKNSRFNLFVLILAVSLSASLCAGYQIGKGKFESFNGNRYTEAKSMSDSENTTKTFFSLNRNRPPSHDTPASPCSCSKFFFWRFPKINSDKNIKISRRFQASDGSDENYLCKLTQLFLCDDKARLTSFKDSFPWPWSRKFLSVVFYFFSAFEIILDEKNCDSKNSNESEASMSPSWGRKTCFDANKIICSPFMEFTDNLLKTLINYCLLRETLHF